MVKEFRRLFVDIGFDHVENAPGEATSFGLGAYLPFTLEASAPYLGAALRWQWTKFGGQGAGGFVVTPTLGMSWRRKDSLGFRVEAGLFYDLYQEHAVDRLIPGSALPHRSYGLDLWVATWL